VEPAGARVLRIRNTLALDRFVASDAFAPEVASRPELALLAPPRPWAFDAAGDFDPAGDLLAGPAAG
jgi:hypothetical protein